MTKLLPAIYEDGIFKPISPLKLPDHQKVLLAIAISKDEIPSWLISKLAERSESFQEENIYSLSDGEEI